MKYNYAAVFATCAANGIMYKEAVLMPLRLLVWLYDRFIYEREVEDYKDRLMISVRSPF